MISVLVKETLKGPIYIDPSWGPCRLSLLNVWELIIFGPRLWVLTQGSISCEGNKGSIINKKKEV